MEDLDLILQEYVATANDPDANGNWDLINSTFADEFEKYGWDENVMKEYVKTANDPKANGDWDLINSKFPEFKSDESLKIEKTNKVKWNVSNDKNCHPCPSNAKCPGGNLIFADQGYW